MSTKKARLLRVDSYKRLHYFNLYNSKETIKNNKLQNIDSNKIKVLNKSIKDNKSLLYSSVYERGDALSVKNKENISINSYPIFMEPFLTKTSNNNFNTNYDIYNIKLFYENRFYVFNNILEFDNLLFHKKFYLYKKQSSYFNKIYKHIIRHKYEKEDQNKLSYRKLNINLLQNLL